tara:strand:- start:113 stop:1696 length:1584 start_codon:yes stop_codon:yes gene_type:complete
MASTFSDLLKIELIGDGEQSGSWGDTTNNNFSQSLEHSIAGVLGVNTGSSTAVTLTTGNGPQAQADNQARQASLVFSGASANCVVTVPATQKIYFAHNTNASNTITLRLAGGTTDHVIPASTSVLLSTTGSAWHALTPGSFTAGGTVSNTSGDITIDAVGDIILDADNADIFLKDAGTTFGSLTNTSGNLIIKSGTTTAATFSGANVTFAGTIASGAIDTSAANITSGGLLKIDVDSDADDLTGDSATGRLTIGAGEDLNLYHGGTNSYIVNDTGNLIIDTAGDIILDADDGDVFLKDNGTTYGALINNSGNLRINSGTTTAVSFSGANVTFAGTINSGAITATGASITALSASNLGSGTIPDARFPSTLPAASAANLTSIPAANITGTLPAIDGSNLTGVETVPSSNTAVGGLKEFAIFFSNSGAAAASQLISPGDTLTPSSYSVGNMHLGAPDVIEMVPSAAGNLVEFGIMRGFRGSSDITGKTRATETGTWRCISAASYQGGTTGGGSGINYHLSVPGLFQRIS